MKHAFARILADYGMILVLVLLCAFLSVATYSEQFPAGESAATQVAAKIRQAGAGPRVLIAAQNLPDDVTFARRLEAEIKESGAAVPTVVIGSPSDARTALKNLAAAGGKLNFIACTAVTRDWLVFADLKADFPALGEPRIVAPQPYMWPNFLKSANVLNIASQVAIIAIIAIGMTMVIITGGIDLSSGSLMALAAVLAARLIRDYAGAYEASAVGLTLACVAAVVACGVVGAFSGTMITRFDLPPFIVTLAMMLVGRGLAYRLANGQSIEQVPASFVAFDRGESLLRIPNAVMLMVGLYIVAHVVMCRTRLGRHLYAVGGNRQAARLSGVPVSRVLITAYIASGLLAGLGGVLMASQFQSGSPTYGDMYELYAIAAVVVGGASLSGGEGRMFGTLTGAFTIAVIQNGMNLASIESNAQKIVLGFVILGAVLFDKIRPRRR